jgi:3-hydroxyisobutyrate dehydrogenase-like beta-hydroxyacid dehydrogenase
MAEPSGLTVAMFGLGEAGSLISADLAAAGATVNGYDPADVATPPGVHRHSDPASAVAGAALVLSAVAESDMMTAVTQAAEAIAGTAVYAELGTGSPGLMRQLAAAAATAGFEFVDVGMMATVPGHGLSTPSMAAGPAAERLARLLNPLGARIEVIGDQPGDAMVRKLLRSVVVKGLAGLVIEAVRAADAAGCAEWLWENICQQIETADAAFVRHLVEGLAVHHVRRTDEMAASTELLKELGVPSGLAAATVAEYRLIASQGVPSLPASP